MIKVNIIHILWENFTLIIGSSVNRVLEVVWLWAFNFLNDSASWTVNDTISNFTILTGNSGITSCGAAIEAHFS